MKDLKSVTEKENFEQARQSDLERYLKKLEYKNYIPFLDGLSKNIDFIKEKKVKEDNGEIKLFGKSILDFKKSFEQYENLKQFKELFKFSFNNKALNKNVQDIENQIKSLKQNIKQEVVIFDKNKKAYDNIKKFLEKYGNDEKFREYKEKGFLEKLIFPLEDLVDFLKLVKGYSKTQMSKYINDIVDGVKENDFSLYSKSNIFFNFKEDNKNEFKKYITLIEEVKKRKIKPKEFQGKNHKFFKFHFENYKDLCSLYRDIAQTHGALKAKISNLEKQEEHYRKLKYWSNFLIINKKRKVVLIEKEKKVNLEKFIKQNENNQKTENFIINIESFTFQALEKLIFSKINDGIWSKVNKKYYFYHDEKKGKRFTRNKFNVKDNITDQEKINLYQHIVLDIIQKDPEKFNLHYIELTKQEYKTLDEFRIDLEKNAYKINKIYLNQEGVEKLYSLIDFVFDLNQDHKIREKQNYKYLNHFWENIENGNIENKIKIAPEGTLFLSKKEKGWKREGEEGKFVNRNRRLNDDFIVKFSVDINKPANVVKYNITNKDKLKDGIESFNKKFLESTSIENSHFFGIDVGDAELATLSVLSKNDIENKNFGQKIEVYKVKDGVLSEEEKKLAEKNISVLLKEKGESVLEKKFVDFIDLTTAKVVGGKIIEDADLRTYYKLKILSAKQEIEKIVNQENIKSSKIVFKPKEEKYPDRFVVEENGKLVMYYDEHIKKVEPYEKNIISDLENYFLNRKVENIEKENINNYKNALVANSIGIVSFLQKQYQNNFVVFEFFEESKRKANIDNKGHNVITKLYFSFYRKMQSLELAPPNIPYSDFIDLSNKKDGVQIGNLLFVNEGETSQICFKCGENIKKKVGKDDFKKMKFSLRKIICPTCNAEYDPDQIACLNIAERGYELINKKQEQ